MKSVTKTMLIDYLFRFGSNHTTASTDHSREYVPLLVYSKALTQPVNLGTRDSLADVGATIADLLNLPAPPIGASFADVLT